jgi:hypothetical protein
LRGDRCEGLYIQNVGGVPLLIASWTATFLDRDPTAGHPLTIGWQIPPAAGTVHLRAQGLRRRLYYRMDADRPSGSMSFTWPTDILVALGIARHEVGLTGVTSLVADGAAREIYLPLDVETDARVGKPTRYRLVLLPGVELAEIYLSLAPAAPDSVAKTTSDAPVGYGYYPAERPVEIPVSGPPEPGLYHLEIGATLKNGGAAATNLWFYHPAR